MALENGGWLYAPVQGCGNPLVTRAMSDNPKQAAPGATNPETSPEEKPQKPTTVILVRHGQNDWVGKNKLPGWTPGIHLNDHGHKQAESVGQRLATADIKIDAIYSSPLERTMETALHIADHLQLDVLSSRELGEVEYGAWTGKEIKELAKLPEWQVVQFYPSDVVFPEGEALLHMQARAVQEINRLVRAHPEQTLVVVSHADLIKSVLAHYLGVHLDLFQRIVVSPASLSVITFTRLRPMIQTVNDTSHLPPDPKKEESADTAPSASTPDDKS